MMMKTGSIIALIVGIVAAAIAVVIAASMATATVQNNGYCQDWSLQIEQRRSELAGEWIQTDQELDIFNQEVEDYNAECAA